MGVTTLPRGWLLGLAMTLAALAVGTSRVSAPGPSAERLVAMKRAVSAPRHGPAMTAMSLTQFRSKFPQVFGAESHSITMEAPQGSIRLTPQQALQIAESSHFGSMLAGAKQVLAVHAAVLAGPRIPLTTNGYLIIALGVRIPFPGGGFGIDVSGAANVASIVVDGATEKVTSAMDSGPSGP